MAKRYIDCDEALELLKKHREHMLGDCEKTKVDEIYEMACQHCEDVIRFCVPTADVVERKRGEWIYEPPNGFNGFKGDYLCSCCKYPVGVQKQNFCPNCGVDMREDGHND